ncbi:MAG: hypothetical protein ACPF9K_07920 [Neptuniibacter sp.]
MRTLIFIAIGVGSWACFYLAMRFTGSSSCKSVNLFPTSFAVIWFIVAGINLWIGVSEAGYTFLEELPIFLVIYLPVVALAFWSTCRFKKSHTP